MQIPFVVAGNKADLEDKRQVTKQQGLELAQKFNAPFLEVPLPPATLHSRSVCTDPRECAF
jgi:hypothetical protein